MLLKCLVERGDLSGSECNIWGNKEFCHKESEHLCNMNQVEYPLEEL